MVFLFIYLIIYTAPSIPDESTAVLDINRLLLSKKEWLESFISNVIIKDMIWEILEYIPIDISFKEDKLRNIDLSTY